MRRGARTGTHITHLHQELEATSVAYLHLADSLFHCRPQVFLPKCLADRAVMWWRGGHGYQWRRRARGDSLLFMGQPIIGLDTACHARAHLSSSASSPPSVRIGTRAACQASPSGGGHPARIRLATSSPDLFLTQTEPSPEVSISAGILYH